MEIEPINLTQIIVAIISNIAIVYSSWKQGRGSRRKQFPPRRKVTVWHIFICAFTIVLLANLVYALCPPTDVKIIYPHDGGTVEINEVIRGTSQRIPGGHTIWIVIYCHEVRRYYPQPYHADFQANGNWFFPVCIGIDRDAGKKFDIIVLLVGKSGQKEFNDYLVEAEKQNSHPGLERLPEDAIIYDRITVTRI